MFKFGRAVGVCSLILTTTLSNAQATPRATPDDHAPIGVMGDHIHKQGEWMLSYRYSSMWMEGNRDGTNGVSRTEVLNDFMVAPLNMRMNMHMLGMMYGATDNLTIMGMVPYVEKTMEHVNRGSVYFTTKTEGVGDMKISGLYSLYESDKKPNDARVEHQLLVSLGVSLPTGSIDERGDTPAGNNQKLPYPMQLGSGTVDPLLGLTYLNKQQYWSWGTQFSTVLRFGENSENYRLGNEYNLNLWVARAIDRNSSISFRLEGKTWGDIHGRDSELNVMMAPGARTDLRGGKRIDALVGFNLYQPEGRLAGNRLALELGTPIYQNLDGPQLETDYRITLGWQWAF